MRRALAIALVAALAAFAPAARAAPAETITVAVSGDLLVHEAVARQARAYAGGAGYDFRPMFRRVRPLIAGADLALSEVDDDVPASAGDRGSGGGEPQRGGVITASTAAP